jgi:hypothetical protein
MRLCSRRSSLTSWRERDGGRDGGKDGWLDRLLAVGGREMVPSLTSREEGGYGKREESEHAGTGG